ncbi:AraC family transcriptional regulator [Rhodococcus sp. UNC363MFTsu5.1]|uniref:AraC family transcriptional regulator n=1 Tax=Rhodococcus sp. UNC363MFTsu5.1 TaxID=1449069 RepID=UPI0018CC3698|nr:GyrI-like domain-containing protein [Rhodococcus sp. UNC363MFTsu5.1]
MTLQHISTRRIAFVRVTGPFGLGNARAMSDIKQWASGRGLLQDGAVLCGVPRDDPSATPPDECRYDAAIVVSDDLELDGAVGDGNLRGGPYAAFDVPHTTEGVGAAWSSILDEIETRGLVVDDEPIFEMYTSELLARHLCQLWVPLRQEHPHRSRNSMATRSKASLASTITQ